VYVCMCVVCVRRLHVTSQQFQHRSSGNATSVVLAGVGVNGMPGKPNKSPVAPYSINLDARREIIKETAVETNEPENVDGDDEHMETTAQQGPPAPASFFESFKGSDGASLTFT
jgi:hypothetical protein